MNVGHVFTTNYINTSGQVSSPVMRNHTQSISPVASAEKAVNGSNALFLNYDGDSAELSYRAMGIFNIPMTGSSFTKTPDKETPETVENGLLKELEPQGTCHTCQKRKYVDQSNDASVSFQTPTSINPNMAAAAVASHEQEHVRNEQARANREDREIVSQTVTLTYDICPECGKSYVSGGTTKTTSVSKSDSENIMNAESSPEEDK